MSKSKEVKKVVLKNVRLSFPSLFKKETFEGKETKFAATFLIDKKDTSTKKELDALIAQAIKDSGVKVPQDKICLKDGDESELDGFPGHWSIKASNGKRPLVMDRDKTTIAEEDNKVYAGCYVNAVIDVWVQNNAYGKRVNANLHGVQFVKDGEAFAKGVDAEEVANAFDELEEVDL